jgi:hypothetical protein
MLFPMIQSRQTQQASRRDYFRRVEHARMAEREQRNAKDTAVTLDAATVKIVHRVVDAQFRDYTRDR